VGRCRRRLGHDGRHRSCAAQALNQGGQGHLGVEQRLSGRRDDAAGDGARRLSSPRRRAGALAAVLCSNAARIYGLPTKGTLEVGKDADIAVVDPNLERVVDPAKLESFADYSPYEGMKLKGWPGTDDPARSRGDARRRDRSRSRAPHRQDAYLARAIA
jgi:hypothetical protein